MVKSMTFPFSKHTVASTFLLLACVFSPPGAQANPAAAAQATLEASVDEALGNGGLDRQIKWEVSRQGFAEALEFETQVLSQGLVSPRGWVLDCPGLARYSRQWLDATDTFTGVSLGASWLEHWGVECKPRQKRVWTHSDVRRIGRATARAVEALPPQWPDVSHAYRPSVVKEYLNAINAHAGLEIKNRSCAREVSKAVRQGKLTISQAVHQSKQCPSSSEHTVLENDVNDDRYEGVSLATVLDSSFLALDRWVFEPALLTGLFSKPKAVQELVVEMAVIAPVPSVVALREAWAGTPEVARRLPSPSAKSQRLQETLADAAAPVFIHWPTPHQCAVAGTALRQALREAEEVSFVLGTLSLWPRLAVVCPSQAPSHNDRPLVDSAMLRAASVLEPGPGRRALSAPLFDEYLEQIQADNPPSRRRCVEAVLAQTKAMPDTVQQGLRRARAVCPVAYQGTFASSAELAP